eukprot:Opistho-2@22215
MVVTTRSRGMSDPPFKHVNADGSVQKFILKHGKGDRPLKDAHGRVRYIARRANGTVLSATKPGDHPFEFQLNKGHVLPGWDIAVASMQRGEMATFRVESKHAYGKAGVDDGQTHIDPHETLEYEFELVDWEVKSGAAFLELFLITAIVGLGAYMYLVVDLLDA